MTSCGSICLVNICNHGESSFSTAHIIILPLSLISVKNTQLETKRQKTHLITLLGCNATDKTNECFGKTKLCCNKKRSMLRISKTGKTAIRSFNYKIHIQPKAITSLLRKTKLLVQRKHHYNPRQMIALGWRRFIQQ